MGTYILVAQWCFDLTLCVSNIFFTRNSKRNTTRTNHKPSLEVSDVGKGQDLLKM